MRLSSHCETRHTQNLNIVAGLWRRNSKMRSALTALLRYGFRTTLAADVLREIAALPVCDLDVVLNGRPALVLAPHPDDESLGCGGLLAEATSRGYYVHLAVLTDGT